MMRVLTEDEYQALVNAGREAQRKLADTLQDLCTRVANHEPVEKNHGRPWECILTATSYHPYCDYCPVIDVCPSDQKDYSK